MLLVLFGPPGVGKSFVGRILAESYGFYFYDADDDLTPAMVESIQEERLFTPEMRYEFFNTVITNTQKLTTKHKKVAIAQALIKEINRLQLKEHLPAAQFIQIIADIDITKQRLKIRNNWVSIDFAEKIYNVFEIPILKHTKLDNNLDKSHIHNQLCRFSHLQEEEFF